MTQSSRSFARGIYHRAIRSALGIGDRTPLLLSVAEFTSRKRHHDTIAAIAKLGRSEVHLAIAGDWAKPTLRDRAGSCRPRSSSCIRN